MSPLVPPEGLQEELWLIYSIRWKLLLHLVFLKWEALVKTISVDYLIKVLVQLVHLSRNKKLIKLINKLNLHYTCQLKENQVRTGEVLISKVTSLRLDSQLLA